MKKGFIWIALTCLMVISMVLASCKSSSTTETTSTTNITSSSTTSTTSTAIIPTSTTSTAVVTTAVTTTSTGNWWDSLGTPQYGGTMTIRQSSNIVSWDPYNTWTLTTIESAYMERLTADDWTLSPSVFNFQTLFRPIEDHEGLLADTWELNGSTLIFNLRQDVYWQNIAPANGRQFVASDIVFQYDREFGLGDGFTAPAPFAATQTIWQSLQSVTATDKYTVAFNWKTNNPEFIMEAIDSLTNAADIVCPDAVAAYTTTSNPLITNWHNAIGTGPFILTDFVDTTSATLVKNPNYFGNDERYPKNQLPYIDELNVLIIPNTSTALAAVRVGKIDFIDNVPLSQAQGIAVSNPGIVQIAVPLATAITIDPRNDKAPFNNVQVREALQMAINLPEIASTYYNGTSSPNPSTLTSNYLTGWGFPYSQWPASLQGQYAYNPTQAKQLLATAGYPNGFNTDVVANNSGDLVLLQIVQSYFAAIGVNMSIITMDPASWTNYVQTNHSQDALAQRGLSGLLGVSSEPITQLTRLLPGYGVNWLMVNDPVFNAFYPATVAASSVDQVKQIVMQANQYVAAQHFIISLLQPPTISLTQSWFKGYDGQTWAISVTSGGPPLFGFYYARFWIDHNRQ